MTHKIYNTKWHTTRYMCHTSNTLHSTLIMSHITRRRYCEIFYIWAAKLGPQIHVTLLTLERFGPRPIHIQQAQFLTGDNNGLINKLINSMKTRGPPPPRGIDPVVNAHHEVVVELGYSRF